jgi:hypothetical protein
MIKVYTIYTPHTQRWVGESGSSYATEGSDDNGSEGDRGG